MNHTPESPRTGGVRVRPPAAPKETPAPTPAPGELAGLRARLARASLTGFLVFVAMWLVNAQSLTNPVDNAVWQASLTWRTGTLDAFFSVLTQAFNTLPMTIYVLVALGFFIWRYRSAWPLATLGVTMILAPLTVTLIKNLVDRPRPSLTHRLVEELTFSFPSGHSTSTAAFCATLFLTAYPALTQRGRRALGAGRPRGDHRVFPYLCGGALGYRRGRRPSPGPGHRLPGAPGRFYCLYQESKIVTGVVRLWRDRKNLPSIFSAAAGSMSLPSR